LRLIPRRFIGLHGLSWPTHFPRHLGALLLVLAIAACAGGGGGGGGGDSTAAPVVQVSITPTSANVDVGTGTQPFSATVAHSTNTTVSWLVGGVTGGNATLGLVSTSGMYSAPASLPAPATVTITAVSAADPTKQASATVSLVQPTVSPPGVPSVPSGLAASNVSPNSVTLSWTASTDAGGPGIGGYYVYRNGNQIATVSSGTSYTDTALVTSTSYSYQVAAFDNAAPPNVSALSAALSVTTLANTQAPTVPTGLASSNVTSTSLTLTWAASTGATGVGGYLVYRNGVQIATVSSGTSYNDSGLSASTTYSYQVAAFDKASVNLASVSALSAPLSVTTSAPTQPPTVPTGLTASSIATGSITLTWAASTDSVGPGVGGYYVYRNGAQIATVSSGTTYTDSPLTALTSYSYQVAAFDKSSPPSISALSAPLGVTTLADTQAPTVPTGLAASNVTSSTVPLSWNASTDLPIPGATGVGGYYVYRNNTQIATVSSSTSYTDFGRTASTNYSYQVAAFDKATPANVSARSSAVSVTTESSTLTITPRNAALTLLQTQQFTTNAPGGTTLNWSVDGVAAGNSTVGTISSGGLYTPPTSAGAGTHSVSAVSSTNISVTGSAAVAVTDLTGITTYHNDVARTGQNLQEYALTPTTVSGGGTFGKRWSCPLDGTVYAQPLYVANLPIGGGTHNVLFVVTMHDSIYAFDADNPGCVTYWHVSLINPPGITTQSSANAGCNDILVEYGITGTPVIDPVAQTIYLVAATTENGTNFQRLHALSLATGTEQAHSPVVIQSTTLPGTGDGGTTLTFNPLYQNQRLGLALTGGNVVIGWSSHCDNYLWPWHGWIMLYNATSLAQTAAFNDTPNGPPGNAYGGIWMSGGAPALDSSGNMFVSTGNGDFDATTSVVPPALAPNNDYGESFINLNPSTLAVQDFYTPSQNASWTDNDYDLSSSGVTVLPDGVGPTAHPDVLVGSDKQGHLWMIDRDSMSGFSPTADNTVQYLTLPNATTCQTLDQQCVYATPAYWSGTVYIAIESGPLMALQLSEGLFQINGQVAVAASQSAETYGYPSPTAMISASPSGGAIVWVLDNNANGTDNGSAGLGPAILRAYNATNLATKLYSSTTLPADTGGNAAKFTVPVVANGHVYVAGAGALTVYGLAP
jgi:chitodextrinase